MAELVDALDLGSSSGDRMGVQVSPLAPHRWSDVVSTFSRFAWLRPTLLVPQVARAAITNSIELNRWLNTAGVALGM